MSMGKAKPAARRWCLVRNSCSPASARGCLRLAALGFVLIINAVGAVNFAQGDFVMAGGYAVVATALLPLPWRRARWRCRWCWSPWRFSACCFPPSPIAAARPAGGRGVHRTIAVGLILRAASTACSARRRARSTVLTPEMAGAMFSQVATIAAALLVAAVHGLLKHTQFGRLRASAQDPEMAAAIGVPVTWMVMATFALATALAESLACCCRMSIWCNRKMARPIC